MTLATKRAEVNQASTGIITLGELVRGYFRWKDITCGSEHSKRAYHADVTRLARFIREDAPADALNRFSLHRFAVDLNDAGLAIRSRVRILTYAKDFVNWAARAGIYPDNFSVALKIPRIAKTMPKAPSAKEVSVMLDGNCLTSWPERDRCIAELLYCNLRVCEVTAIQLEDITADVLLVHGKGKRERKIFLTPTAQKSITEYLPSRDMLLQVRGRESNTLLLNRKTAQRLDVRSVHRIVKAIAHAKGLPRYISPVKLRGAYATHMLDRGAPLSAVSQLLGHENLSTTMHYVGGVTPKRMRESYDRTFKR